MLSSLLFLAILNTLIETLFVSFLIMYVGTQTYSIGIGMLQDNVVQLGNSHKNKQEKLCEHRKLVKVRV